MIGKLFVFEGPDGVGKTTLVQNAINFLHFHEVPLTNFSFPGNIPGTLGHMVYKLHHAQKELHIVEITPLALQAMHIAAHLDTIESRIKPAINEGNVVILDRTWWSTWVYGQAAQVNEPVLAKLIEAEQLCWGDITPDMLFLIQRASAFKAEHSQEAFNKLSSLYEELTVREELRYPIVRIANDDLHHSTHIIQESISSILKILFLQ